MRLLSAPVLFAVFGIALLGIASAADTPQQLADKAKLQTNAACKGVTTESQCHTKYIAGCGKSATSAFDSYLDFFKNQLPATDSTAAEAVDPTKLTDLEKATPASLTEGNHKDFSDQFVKLNEGEIVDAIGFLYYAEQTGKESSNCYLNAQSAVDFHIGIGFASGRVTEAKAKPGAKTSQFLDLQANSMIVEMTPHYRAQFEPGWTLTKLTAAYGMQVKVVGQLIADNDHHSKSDDCALGGATSSCWRLSIWEIHPVTSFFVCTASGGCPNASSSGWTKLEDWSGSSGGGTKHKPKHKPHSPPPPA